MARRWMVGAAAAATGVALYALLGFVAVPRLVQWQVPRIAATELQQQGSVGDVHFNPFTLRLVADKLALAQSDGRPLATVDRVVAQADWRSPFRRAWSLRELRIEGPAVFVAVDTDGRSNIGQLLETLQSRPRKEREGQSMPRIIVENIAVLRGRVNIDDRQASYAEQIEPIELQLDRLSTLPQDVDDYQLTADIASGGRVLWRGEASLNPLRARGEVTLQSVRLQSPGAYLGKLMRVVLTDGALSAKLPYSVAADGAGLQAQLANGALSIDGLMANRSGVKEPFAVVKRLEITGVSGDLAAREVVVDAVRAVGGQFVMRRDFRGEFDLANLSRSRGDSGKGDPPAEAAQPWKATVKQVQFEQIALRAVDASVDPPTTWEIDRLGLELAVNAQGSADGTQAQLRSVNLRAEGFSAAQGEARPVRIERLNLANGSADLAKRRIDIGQLSVEGGLMRVTRDEQGEINLTHLTRPAAASQRKPGTGADWSAQARQVAVSGLSVDVEDQSLGLRTQVQDLFLRANEVGTDPTRPVPFEAGLRLREGGQLAMNGEALAAAPSLTADVQLSGLALPTAQPVLERYLRLKLTAGTMNLQGRLDAARSKTGAPDLRFKGNGEIAGLRLLEANGQPFASWRTLSAKGITASLAGVDIPELRLVGSDASVTIQPDRTINAARLLVPQRPEILKTAARQNVQPSTAASSELFPVRIGALRVQDSRLKFTDLSLRPEFDALIHKLNGTIVGLSTRRGTRSQIELDGAVDEFGLARIRGALNPFEPRENTDVSVVFRNLDMVHQNPYSMKFAGYRIDAGKMSLDLRYQVRNSQLAGDNKIVIDQLTLGEKVDSPDATKLPVALAVSILKDDQGRIDLGLPVSGNLDDPEFNYGALIWKALVSLVTKVITAPFRAMAGGSGDQNLEAIEFDPGSAQLLPPEREKLAHVAQVLNKREQFKLSVPAGYAQEADAAALRARAVHQELARRAGLPPAAQESGSLPDLGDSRVQSAVRELYAQRFGDAELDKARVAAQNAPPNTAALGASGSGQTQHLTVFQQFRRAMRGEPQVADTGGFYGELLKRLEQQQSLPPDALTRLGQQRAEAVTSALAQAGVSAQRLTAAAPTSVDANDQRMVPLKLALDLH